MRLILSALIVALACATPAAASELAKARETVTLATAALERFAADPDMQWFRDHVHEVRGIVVVPEFGKAGLILGGSGGSGVLLARPPSGEWSHPAFYAMGAVTFGLQIGAEAAEVVLLVMSEKGMEALYSTEFKLGADASVAAGPTGAGTQSATADILAFSRTKGVFAGLTVEGSVINTLEKRNAAYYGQVVSAREIVAQGKVSNPDADALRATLARIAGGAAVPASPSAGGQSSETGDESYDLRRIQAELAVKGYDPGPIDGLMGGSTRQAIRDYQAAEGLAVTGEPSATLQQHLLSR